jgi:hypothetical protein
MTVMVACVMLLPFLFVGLLPAMERGEVTTAVQPEEYELYGRIIEDKFLTSQIQLVLLERMTVSRLVPNQPESMTMAFVQQQRFFDGVLPEDLVRDFVGANQVRTRLEGRFQFGVRYRFVLDQTTDDREASVAVLVKQYMRIPTQAPMVLDRLGLSRVGRTVRNDQALVYVENVRPDGTGAGFLVWLHREARQWVIFDTEVVWTIRSRAGDSKGP